MHLSHAVFDIHTVSAAQLQLGAAQEELSAVIKDSSAVPFEDRADGTECPSMLPCFSAGQGLISYRHVWPSANNAI